MEEIIIHQDFREHQQGAYASPVKSDKLKEALKTSSLTAAAGTNGIRSLLYSHCSDSLGDTIIEVVTKALDGESEVPLSMRTAIMVFGSKPKKPLSIRPSNKRRISVLN
jgi:hypothetical protein